MVVLAICQGPAPGEQVGALALAVVLPIAYVLLMIMAFHRSTGLRDRVIVYVAGFAVGALALTQPDGDPDADYLMRLFLAVALVAVGAAMTANVRGGEPWRYVLTGVLGASAFGAFVLWIITAIAATGSCID